MTEKIFCFSLGLSAEDIEKGRASFSSVNDHAPAPEVIAITSSMLDRKVGDVLAGVLDDLSGSEAMPQNEGNDVAAGRYPYRMVVVLAQEREQVLQVMRSFKAVLPDPREIIFAVITQTALDWTFAEYAAHLGGEHESMKKRRPEDNPDMKKM